MTEKEFNSNRYGLKDFVKDENYTFQIIGIDFERGMFFVRALPSGTRTSIHYSSCELIKED